MFPEKRPNELDFRPKVKPKERPCAPWRGAHPATAVDDIGDADDADELRTEGRRGTVRPEPGSPHPARRPEGAPCDFRRGFVDVVDFVGVVDGRASWEAAPAVRPVDDLDDADDADESRTEGRRGTVRPEWRAAARRTSPRRLFVRFRRGFVEVVDFVGIVDRPRFVGSRPRGPAGRRHRRRRRCRRIPHERPKGNGAPGMEGRHTTLMVAKKGTGGREGRPFRSACAGAR